MMAAMLQYLANLTPRERRIAIVGGIAALLLLILAILLPLQRHVGAGEQRLERKRDDLVWLRSMAPQLAGLRTSGAPPLRESLVVVVDRPARPWSMQALAPEPSMRAWSCTRADVAEVCDLSGRRDLSAHRAGATARGCAAIAVARRSSLPGTHRHALAGLLRGIAQRRRDTLRRALDAASVGAVARTPAH